MKLELKHLAPYLPYGIQVKKIHPIIVSEYCIEVLDTLLLHRMFSWGEDSTLNPKWIKPMLLPLTALTEEIEHNGERFVPIDWLNENKDVRLIRGRDSRGNRIVFNEHTNTTNIRFWEYCIIEKLAEWHIDIFQLIPAGLAVDKREVDNG